ncbi:MAG: ABC transporter ATP-binding protein [Spirochaetales bacterium]|nr:ABC transporter ATP-binding protein [Spirochaetales bacterium]
MKETESEASSLEDYKNKAHWRVVLRGAATVWRADPLRMSLVLVAALADGFVPVLGLLLMRAVVDLVVSGGLSGAGGVRLGLLSAAWLATMVGQYSLSTLSEYLAERTSQRAARILSGRIMDKGLSFAGLAHFEDPAYHDLSGWVNYVFNPVNALVYQTADLVKHAFQFVSVAAVFAALDWWIPLALALSVVPGALASLRTADARAKLDEDLKKLDRKVMYLRGRALSAQSAKELRIFGFDRLFRRQAFAAFRETDERNAALARRNLGRQLGATAFRVAAAGGVFLYLAARVRTGAVSAGSLALFLQAIFQFSSSVLMLVMVWSYTRFGREFFLRLFAYLALGDTLDLSRSTRVLDGPLRELRFEDVSFSYPSGAKALEGVSFTLREGDSLALVGENGAGKSTIVKLVARFYDPTGGRVLANGVDLRELEPRAWRERLSAAFQDFCKFELTLAENVFADEADRRSLASEKLPDLLGDALLAKLPEGESTMLGTEFGGRELSGGQWQRVALLRAFAKRHELLMVDEPTASIDPLEEAAVFRAILARESRMTLLVTHRLGSIRQATRVLVLKSGRLVAEGAHDELLERDEYYATLWNSQAELYR